MTLLYDIHTHHTPSPYDLKIRSIVNIDIFQWGNPQQWCEQSYYSLGIHPWNSISCDVQMDRLKRLAANERVVAIGETGIDKLRGPSLDEQLQLFIKQIEIAETVKKPLIIHCVKAWNELIEVRRHTKPLQPWIIHGYRGKPALTRQLVKEGFLFSIGYYFNEQSISLIPLSSLFCETDDGEKTIEEVYLHLGKALNVNMEELALRIEENIKRMMPIIV